MLDTPDVAPGDGMAKDVNNLTSLRAAIMEANALGGIGAHSIQFSGATFGGGGQINLTQKMPDLTASVQVVNAPTNGVVTIGGANAGTAGMFTVRSSSNSSFTRLVFAGGTNFPANPPAPATGNGGAFDIIGGIVAFTDCMFTLCRAAEGGAIAVYASGRLNMTNCDVVNNTTPQGAQQGGGVSAFTGAVVSIGGSRFTDNQAKAPGAAGKGGGLAVRDNTTVTVESTVFARNLATTGGGIYVSGGRLTLGNSRVEFNRADQGGGGIEHSGSPANGSIIENVSIVQNTAGTEGGGIYHGTTQLLIRGCTFTQNEAQRGGGLYQADGTLTLQNAGGTPTLFDRNTATEKGGGLFQAGGTLDGQQGTRFEANTAVKGGGVYQKAGTSTYYNVSWLYNTATTWGGAIHLEAGSMYLDFCPIDSTNTAGAGGGKIAYKAAPPGLAWNMIWWINQPSHMVQDPTP